VIGDEPGTPSKIPDLRSRLYRKAKNGRRHKVSSHRHQPVPRGTGVGSLSVLRLQGL